ncbi:DUF418 domain-containing protein [Plantactinospora sp. S1510]|uniref:DUF418 domain-containing protein n=1 Tax=Plantactinospora alkalitolerans TaxID=2789879 RepID=A0ABS0GP21_9ACTN|nr:DUF418 domain-containing protein [Plantactinospora alkalitolerans]
MQEAATTSTAGPRLADVDALRGLALLGILVVNITYFASGYPFHLVGDPSFDSWIDRGVISLVEMLVAMKAYLLFAFLFGYSFTLQMESAARRGVDFVPQFRRRVVGLFALGVLHAVLLFHGDILSTYAVFGLVLLAARQISARTAVIAATALLGTIAFLVALAAVSGASITPDHAEALAAGQVTTDALRGGLGSVILEHLRSLPAMVSALAVQGPLALSAFLLGLAAGKRQALGNVARHSRLLRRVELVGYPLGLTGALLFVVGGGTGNLTGLMISIVTAPLLTAAYVATALRLFRTERGARVASALAPAGRMSLSNYLGQSLICVLIFTGLGLGQVGELAPLTVLLLAIAVFCGQLALSAWWLGRHRYGPAEWALRAWTNQERPEWSRPSA